MDYEEIRQDVVDGSAPLGSLAQDAQGHLFDVLKAVTDDFDFAKLGQFALAHAFSYGAVLAELRDDAAAYTKSAAGATRVGLIARALILAHRMSPLAAPPEKTA
jgi:hypothetical protein